MNKQKELSKRINQEPKQYELSTIRTGKNGFVYVPLTDSAVRDNVIHLSTAGNAKTGPVAAFNLPVELTCDHRCECYKNKVCYACGGCYRYKSNQFGYTENLKFFLTHSDQEFIDTIVMEVLRSGLRVFRWFTCGDIVNYRFFDCMMRIAKMLPFVTFWTYTKKYNIVNRWLDNHGGIKALPANFTSVIFSHWMNKDGSYFPMNNKYNMPTSEFIPYGKEDLLKNVTHVCPCSDPDIFVNCVNCPNPCYKLKPGQSMALCEHSTPETRERDKMIKELKQKALESGNLKLAEMIQKAANLVA